MKRTLSVFLAIVLAGLVGPAIVFAAAPSSTFDFDEDGWAAWAGEGAIAYQSTGGNPGGFLKIEDVGGSSYVVYAPDKFKGNLSAYSGGAFSYDVTVFDPPTQQTSIGSGFGRIQLVGGGSNATFDYAGNPPIPSPGFWTTYNVPLTAAAWNTSQANWDTVLSDVTYFDITLDLRAGSDTIGFDNASLTVTPEPATMALFGLGAGALAFARRRKKLKQQMRKGDLS